MGNHWKDGNLLRVVEFRERAANTAIEKVRKECRVLGVSLSGQTHNGCCDCLVRQRARVYCLTISAFGPSITHTMKAYTLLERAN